MSKIGIKAAGNVGKAGQEHAPPQPLELSEEERSKDVFFVQIAEIAEAMTARHGRDFAIGAFLLSAKFLAEGKPLVDRNKGEGETVSTAKPV